MIKITDIAYYFPQKKLLNTDLEKEFPEWSAQKIEEKVGINQRYISGDNETAMDMGVSACEKLFETYPKENIDFLLFCTQSPDYFLPTSACIMQSQLGLRKNIGAIDYNLGCSGYVYGLAIAKGLIAANLAKNVLLVTSETYTKHLHPQDKANRSIFGDAAAASVVSYDEKGFDFQFNLGTDGSGANNLIVKNGGFRCLKSGDNLEYNEENPSDEHLYMNGPEIFNFTIESIPTLVKNTLESNQKSYEDIDLFVFHQANQFMLNYLRKKTKIPQEKFYINMRDKGNTVSSTVPIALKNAQEEGRLKSGDTVLIAGFGVGYSWGATIITI